MDYFIVVLVTIVSASLTFLSGFGLGTLLLPVFIFFFPVDIAIAATAIVHLANNLFKGLLVGKSADQSVLWKFSIPAAFFALLGAYSLVLIAEAPAIYTGEFLAVTLSITPLKLLVATLMLGFSLLEFLPMAKSFQFSSQYIPLGGALTGFLGGLTGHQGALRSAFLIRLGLDKDAFIGTSILSAIVIDISRLLVYGFTFFIKDFLTLLRKDEAGLIIAGVVAALAGAFLGFAFMKKISLTFIHKLVGILLILYSFALGLGLI